METTLTELEGAVLSEIHHRGASTAFQVRRAFQVSPSVEWSGSAGAIYPAIRRLTEAGLIHAEAPASGRRTRRLSLTAQGIARIQDWIADVGRATGVGLDPFRLRAGLWAHLAPGRRRSTLQAILAALEVEIAASEGLLRTLDPVERRRAEWALILQNARRQWVQAELDRAD